MRRFGASWNAVAAAAVIGLLFALPTVSGAGVASTPSLAPPHGAWSEIPATGWTEVQYREPGMYLGVPTGERLASDIPLTITIVVPFQHPAALSALLATLATTRPTGHRGYLTATEFDQEFGGSAELYSQLVEFVSAQGATSVQEFGDRATLTFQASAPVAGAIFHTSIDVYHTPSGRAYYAPVGAPALPSGLAPPGTYVDGLSSYSEFVIGSDGGGTHGHSAPRAGAPAVVVPGAGYPTPVSLSGVQYQYPSDYQSAYDQLSLFQQYGYPTHAVAATILWSGNYTGPPISTAHGGLTNSQAVPPFDPNDVDQFFNETLPSGEPHPTAVGVPLDGAPLPGPLAGYDSTDASFENTLDLETLGSMAPGATLYNVYGGYPSYAELDQAFSAVLNPNATDAGLANVSVISASVGAPEINDTGWYQDLEEAQSRGISVFAISGDSGDNPSSPWGVGDAWFPGSMAYDTFGTVAVGGSSNVLGTTSLLITYTKAWYDPTEDLGQPVGSSGGMSTVFREPTWQSTTSAASQIAGGARAVPDVAALANNTLLTFTVDGFQFQATNASVNANYYYGWGTSIAAPMEAGIVADVDAVLGDANNSWVGFLDPSLYPLASLEYAPLVSNSTVGFYYSTAYGSSLPTLPLLDVKNGGNYAYGAHAGYDLVTGWGAIDAYNLTMYYLSLPSSPVLGEWNAVMGTFNFSSLDVTSSFGSSNNYYNASIQHNMVVANSLGAPIYWVQNVVYIHGVPGDWQMNFTGWLVYPWYGTEYSLVMYEYNFPLVGVNFSLPYTFALQTRIIPGSGFDSQEIEFSSLVPGAPAVYLPAPGATFIIGDLSYNYSWRGVTETNGPIPGATGSPGGLDPQFGLVGGPGGSVGNFHSGTQGFLGLFYSYGPAWIPGLTQVYFSNRDQTGEFARNLTWTENSPGDPAAGVPATWEVKYVASTGPQGVLEYDTGVLPTSYNVTVNESGLPPGVTWGINIVGALYRASAGSPLIIPLPDGTYTYTAAPPAGYATAGASGSFTVSGRSPSPISFFFAPVVYAVSLGETGLPAGTAWWFNTSLGDVPLVAGTPGSAELPNGSFGYSVSAGGEWNGAPPAGVVAVDDGPQTLVIPFVLATQFEVTFQASGLPSQDTWTVTAGGMRASGPGAAPLGVAHWNGTFGWSASTTDGNFTASPPVGTVTVAGVVQVVPVTFVPVTFNVTFQPVGLPPNSVWGVTIDGATSANASAPAALTVPVPNGTFTLTPTSYDPEFQAQPRPVTVAGSNLLVAVGFPQVLFLVTVTVTGVPTGTQCTFTQGASTSRATAQSGAAVFAGLYANGSYPYTVGLPDGLSADDQSGTFTVDGHDQNLSVDAQSSSPFGGSYLGVPAIGWIALAVVLVVAVTAIALVRRRRRARSGGDAGPSGSSAGGGAN